MGTQTTVGRSSSAMPGIENTPQEGAASVKPGGLCFEVVLEGPKKEEKPNIKCPPTPSLSADDIERKLKESEERRKSMEASTLEKLAEKEKTAEEVRAKKANMPTAGQEMEGTA
eukprot:TRINITY_DN11060_c0_g1_i1.p1 TRINITY_DN11060_c0_g1~~TRINITY_DN11060_c0_g1_i1.p1  ORF type:complete len:122 (-),score=55.37 TRINITY_DN11060_c0_g1_i1:112-453(-)